MTGSRCNLLLQVPEFTEWDYKRPQPGAFSRHFYWNWSKNEYVRVNAALSLSRACWTSDV